MIIQIITPAAADSRAGNRTSAIRWARMFQQLGHRVRIDTQYDNQDADIVVALHAWRSAKAIVQFKNKHPDKPCIVVLTGTDIYRFIHTDPNTTLLSLQHATALVGINAMAAQVLPQEYQQKVRIIFQSTHYCSPRPRKKHGFKICVAGHLRHEKDPLRPALAVRSLPSSSQIMIHHYGKAHSSNWAEQARLETSRNRRYRWYGERPVSELFKHYSESQLFVLPSRMEGGANVISETLRAQLPVIASYIDGNIGLLGNDYPGFLKLKIQRN